MNQIKLFKMKSGEEVIAELTSSKSEVGYEIKRPVILMAGKDDEWIIRDWLWQSSEDEMHVYTDSLLTSPTEVHQDLAEDYMSWSNNKTQFLEKQQQSEIITQPQSIIH